MRSSSPLRQRKDGYSRRGLLQEDLEQHHTSGTHQNDDGQMSSSYNEMSTPPATERTNLQRNIFGRSNSAASQASNILHGSYHQVDSSQNLQGRFLAGTKGLSKTAITFIQMVADVIFATCLLVSFCIRVSVVSFFYLFVFCYGVINSFDSKILTLLTMVVSMITLIGEIVFFVLFKTHSSDWQVPGENILEVIGIKRPTSAVSYVTSIGLEALVMVCSIIHYFYVLKKVQVQKKRFDLFEIGEQMLHTIPSTTTANDLQNHNKKEAMVQWVEMLSICFLFICALAVPAFASGIYYLIFLIRIFVWTYHTKKVTIEQLIHQETKKIYFLGPIIAKLLLALNLIIIFLMYLYQFPQLNQYNAFRMAGEYMGFVIFPAEAIDWNGYVFVVSQILFFMCTAKLFNLHTALSQHKGLLNITSPRSSASPSRKSSSASAFLLLSSTTNTGNKKQEIQFYDHQTDYQEQSTPSLQEKRLIPSGFTQENDIDLKVLLDKEPLFIRMFLQEGGNLLASAAAVVWCVSYPSYLSAPMMAWAFFTLAVYGLRFPAFLVHVLVIYGTLLGIVEYCCNMTIDPVGRLTSQDLTAFGLVQFEFPFLDLSVHNIFLFFIYFSLRTRWRYRDILQQYAAQREFEAEQTNRLRLPSQSLHLYTNQSALLPIPPPNGSSHLVLQTPGEMDGEDQEQQSEVFALQTALRQRLNAGGVKNLTQLWLLDAKEVLLTHMDAIVLFTILAVVLSTQVSFIQVGYLVLAVALMLFFEYRRKFWRSLLVYALVAALAVFVRNVDCKPNDTLDLVGLPCYESTSSTWGALWPSLFTAQLVIIMQLEFQLVIYVANRDVYQSETARSKALAREYPVYFLSRIGIEMEHLFHRIGVILVYVSFLVLAYVFENGSTEVSTTSTTVIGTLQLVLLFIVLSMHLMRFSSFNTFKAKTSWKVRFLWSFVLFFQIGILVARYLYQFEPIAKALGSQNEWLVLFSNTKSEIIITAQDVGFTIMQVHTNTTITEQAKTTSSVFLYLLPTAVLMALCLLQLESLSQAIASYHDWFAAGRSRGTDRLRFWMDSIQKLLIAVSTNFMVLLTMGLALKEINAIGLIYTSILIIGRGLFTKSWRPLWAPLLIYSCLVLLGQYFYQLNSFVVLKEANPLGYATLQWIGFKQIALEGGNIWKTTSDQLLVILACCLQRLSEYLETQQQERAALEAVSLAQERVNEELHGINFMHRVKDQIQATKDQQDKEDNQSVNSVDVQRGDQEDDFEVDRNDAELDEQIEEAEEARDAFELDLKPKNKKMKLRSNQRKVRTASTETTTSFTSQDQKKSSEEMIPVLSDVKHHPMEEDRDFITCLRDFCMSYASKASVNLVMLLLVISCFVHLDAISILYLIIVRSMMYANAWTVCRRWWLLAIVLSMVILSGYMIMLWYPPLMQKGAKDATYPWNRLSNAEQRWLMIGHNHKWSLLTDFVTLLCVYLLPDSYEISLKEQKEQQETPLAVSRVSNSTEWVPASSSSSSSSSKASDEEKSNTQAGLLVEEKTNWFIALTYRSFWFFLEYFVMTYWVVVVLIGVFVFGGCGAGNANGSGGGGGLISFVYLGICFYMLFKIDQIRLPTHQMIHSLRRFNWFHLFLLVILEVPFLMNHLDQCRMEEIDFSNEASTSSVAALNATMTSGSCISVANVIFGKRPEDGSTGLPYGLIVLFIILSVQCELEQHEKYEQVCEYLASDRLLAPQRSEYIVKDYFAKRTLAWVRMRKQKSSSIHRLKSIVSKLVHKVEELMDIALGLHQSLPPMAPGKGPHVLQTSQTSITIAWHPPEQTSTHKIRFYRIARQKFPSMTLLGDFSDMVEVKGNVLQVKIDNLRPGTSYQFKVAAVNRMGEGPFSVPSEPISTLPLNLDDGACTAGWMRYQRQYIEESLEEDSKGNEKKNDQKQKEGLSWIQSIQNWLKKVFMKKHRRQFLEKYVVMDGKRVILYPNEEKALEHRTQLQQLQQLYRQQRRHSGNNSSSGFVGASVPSSGMSTTSTSTGVGRKLRRLRNKFKNFSFDQVLAFRLSKSKIRVIDDEIAPLLHLFELEIMDDNSTSRRRRKRLGMTSSNQRVRYVFQPEVTKEFKMFMKALAFSVPMHALDENVIAYMERKGIQTPIEAAKEREKQQFAAGLEDSSIGIVAPPSSNESSSVVDDGASTIFGAGDSENQSEWSSVTGDESVATDNQDDDDDRDGNQQGFSLKRFLLKSWRLPVYRTFFYHVQDAAFQKELQEYEQDDVEVPSVLEFWFLFGNCIRSHSAWFCYLFLLIAFAGQGDLLNLIYLVMLFGYLLVENPRPPPKAWRFLINYTMFVLILRFCFQLSFFCQQVSPNGFYFPSIQPFCIDPSENQGILTRKIKQLQPMVFFGVFKYDGSIVVQMNHLFKGLGYNFMILLTLIWHRQELKLRGLWMNKKEEKEFKKQQQKEQKEENKEQLQAGAYNPTYGQRNHAQLGHSFRLSTNSSRDSIDESFLHAGTRSTRIDLQSRFTGSYGQSQYTPTEPPPLLPDTSTPPFDDSLTCHVQSVTFDLPRQGQQQQEQTEALQSIEQVAESTEVDRLRDSISSHQSFGDGNLLSRQKEKNLALEALAEIELLEEEEERQKREAKKKNKQDKDEGESNEEGGENDPEIEEEDRREDEKDDAAVQLVSPDDLDDNADEQQPTTGADPDDQTFTKRLSTVSQAKTPTGEEIFSDLEEDDVAIAQALAQRRNQRKVSWLEKKIPRVFAYYARVLSPVPFHWDKDVHAAIQGEKPGKDYYSISLCILLFAAVYDLVFFREFGEPDPNDPNTVSAGYSAGIGQGASHSGVGSSSILSGYMVLLVFLQLCFIIWDRVAYVCSSLPAKLILQYVYLLLMVVFTVWLLLPFHNGSYFDARASLVFFYLQHCSFLWVSALQIKHGYPVFKGSKYNVEEQVENSLYGKISSEMFPLVMAAPFLFEMRALLDYLCTKTSLSTSHWLLLEETAAHLYMVKIEMKSRVEDGNVLQGNIRQPLYKKFLTAGFMLVGLLICLIGPLALFSSANPSTKPNKVTLSTMTFGIKDASDTMNVFYQNNENNSPDFEKAQKALSIGDDSSVQKISFTTFSQDVWSSSPPHMRQLIEQLQSDKIDLYWTLTLSFERPGPTDYQNIKKEFTSKLTKEQRDQLIPIINDTIVGADSSTGSKSQEIAEKAILVDDLYPSILQLTATNGVQPRTNLLRSVNVRKHTSSTGMSWWTIEPKALVFSSEEEAGAYCSNEDNNKICLVAVSDNIVQGLNSLGIGGYGITAVYAFVLLTIGSFVKEFLRGELFKVLYTELPDPQDVLELVEGIYIAREEQYVGHLKDEVRIFETLIRVLRSPETLTKVTGTNIIHIPTAKKKV